jgi:hypothetical protein
MGADEPSRKIGSRWFNANKLDQSKNRDGSFYVDGSDTMANKGFVIDITHVPSGRQIFFKAFIESYTETFSPEWAEETVYGRMDPIYQFKNTTRTLTVALKIPAASTSEAYENLAKVQALAQFLYPNYIEVGSATTIAQSPILRLGVMNIGRSQNQYYHSDPPLEGMREGSTYHRTGRTRDEDTAPDKYGRGPNSGLLGVLTSLTINHNLAGDVGVIEQSAILTDGTSSEPVTGGSILPKLIEINFDFKVIHEHHLGWNQEGEFSNEAFPYGLDFERSGPVNSTRMARSEQETMANVTKRRQSQMEEEENRELAEQAVANAKARYSGIFGNRRRDKDASALRAGNASDEAISAQAGDLAMRNGMLEDNAFDSDEAERLTDYMRELGYDNSDY